MNRLVAAPLQGGGWLTGRQSGEVTGKYTGRFGRPGTGFDRTTGGRRTCGDASIYVCRQLTFGNPTNADEQGNLRLCLRPNWNRKFKFTIDET